MVDVTDATFETEILERSDEVPVVVDADGITACVEHNLFPLPPNWVITPHTGELSRILKVNTQDIEKDRFRAAFDAFEKTKCHVLLKGYRSLIAFEKRCMIIHAGNSALAKAGTGDVLTGMIGGLLAQGMDTLQASATAAYVISFAAMLSAASAVASSFVMNEVFLSGAARQPALRRGHGARDRHDDR